MIKTWLVSGDTHGSLSRYNVLDNYEKDTAAIVILGDVGFNYLGPDQDEYVKRRANSHQNYIYCVRGNHEMRPTAVEKMELLYDTNVNNYVYYEPEFPYIRYFKDGYLYNIDGYVALVLGGAYSVDKHYRLMWGRKWFEDEQLTQEEMDNISAVHKYGEVDFVLSHTCPLSWQPRDLFLEGLDQSTVDNSMEVWMDGLKDTLDWNIWLFGHYHRDRLVRPHVEMLSTNIQSFKEIWNRWNNDEPIPWHEFDPKFKYNDNKWINKESEKWI